MQRLLLTPQGLPKFIYISPPLIFPTTYNGIRTKNRPLWITPGAAPIRWMGPIRNPRWEQKRTEGYVIVSSGTVALKWSLARSANIRKLAKHHKSYGSAAKNTDDGCKMKTSLYFLASIITKWRFENTLLNTIKQHTRQHTHKLHKDTKHKHILFIIWNLQILNYHKTYSNHIVLNSNDLNPSQSSRN